jgi:hypothetical protein
MFPDTTFEWSALNLKRPPHTSLGMAAKIPIVTLVSLLFALTFSSSAGADPLHVSLTRRLHVGPAHILSKISMNKPTASFSNTFYPEDP